MQKEILELVANDIVALVPQDAILEKYDISRSTLYRIRNDPEFKKILNEKRTAIWESTIDTAYAMATVSAQLLTETLKNTDAPLKTRLDAATKIINMTKEHYAEVVVISELGKLKEAVKQMQEYR